MANDKSSLVQIAQATLDQANQSQKVTVVATEPGVQQEVDIAEIAGAAPSAVNPLPVRLTDGSGFYSANAGFILDNVNTTAEQDTATPADNRGSPIVILPGQGQAPISPATSGNQVSTNTKLDTLITQTDGVEGSLTSIDGKTPALGQALAAASVPVVLTAAQVSTLTPQTDSLTDTQLRASAVPVSVSSSALPTGAATLAEQQTQSNSLSAIDASLNDIEAVIEVVGYGSAATAQRVAAEVGSNGAVNSSGNPLYVTAATTWPVRLQDGAGNAIDSQGGALSVQLESLNGASVPGDYGTPTSGSPRVAAMMGVGSAAVSTSNPVPNYATNNLLGVARHDAIVPTFGATTDTYAYKTGGTGGTTVSTVVITYTDATKAVIQSVVRT